MSMTSLAQEMIAASLILRTTQNFTNPIDKMNNFYRILSFGYKDEVTHRVC